MTIRNDDGSDGNSAPVFDPNADYTPEVAENTTAVLTLSATDADNDEITYSIQGGADDGKFTLTGAALAFTSDPDYENPADADSNNEYVVVVRAGDGTKNTDQTIVVSVTNELETLTLSGAATATEGGTDVAVTAELDAAAPAGGVTVTFDTPTGTATQGASADYTLSATSCDIAAGATSCSIAVTVVDDSDGHTITIAANDTPARYTVTLDQTSWSWSEAAPVAYNSDAWKVRLSATEAPSDRYVCYKWRIVHGTTDGDDFSGDTSGVEAFGFGETSGLVVLRVNNDSLDEGDEAFTFEITSVGYSNTDRPSNCSSHSTYGVGSPSSATVTITDDDAAPTNEAPTGAVTITGTATQGETLTADTSGIGDPDGLGTFSYQWKRDGTDIPNATAATYVLTQADVGAAITVTVSWTDDGNTEESLTSEATAVVTNVNDAPTGAVTITGTPTQGQTLTAVTASIADPDGPATLTFSFQWKRVGTDISGATAAAYMLTQADVGAAITVTVSWTDDGGAAESLTSAATAAVADTNDAPTGAVTITGTATQGETLTAVTDTIADPDGLGTFSYQWKRDGTDIPGATGSTYVLAQADVGAAITVTVSWTDDGGAAESLTSAPTAAVTNTNDDPTGSVTVSGTPTQGQTLTAVTTTIADPDGPATLTFSYQWKRGGTDISSATGSTYVLAQDDVGAAITVTVSWTDDGGAAESLTSAATAAVANVNDAPTGAVTISGTPTQGQTLTAVTDTIADPDGPATLTFSYQWKRVGTDISGATGSTYLLAQDDVGAAITVTVSWTDNGNTVESLTSTATAAVANVNDTPTGAVTISGTPTQGQTLTAVTATIADPDGPAALTFSYQWKRVGTDISSATASTYVLTQADVGAAITVTVSWTDDGGAAESLTSAATAAVANVNDAPTGAVTISGTPTQGQTLTAVTATIADPDGPNTLTFSYQWKRVGTDISGATGSTYVLTQDDVGAAITVTVSWTDNGNTVESLTSTATAAVANVNDTPTGAVTISGTPTQGQTLTAVTATIADPDGPNTLTFSFQWKRDGTDISGATASTYTLTQDDVGAAITVTVSWTDNGNTVESLTSTATATVTNTNDEPTGAVTISGTATQGETLTADTSGIADPDGLGTFSYQWERDGTDISGATGATYILTQDDVGAAVTVTVNWTDDGGAAESLTSAATAAVTNTNDPPTGSVTISGTATQGETLTAVTATIADPDGPNTLTFSFQWKRDGTDITGATGATYTLTQDDVGAAITVTVNWTDDGGAAESLTSAPTTAVTNTNDEPTGSVTIGGTATQGETLTAVTSTIADPDGPATLTFSFQWKRDGADIPTATGATYVLTQDDVGAAITVTVSWTDGGNTVESLTSAATAEVTDANDPPTGAVTVSGTATQGETLTAVTSTIADPDGPATLTFSFQWKRDGADIPTATGATYVLTQDDVGAAITVTVSWTDGGNTVESLTSAATAEVTDANDPPTGAVTISGTATQGQTLTAVTATIADPDGPDALTFSFQWKRDGTDISGATGATYVLAQDDVGAAITVTVSWTDDGNTAESLTSAPTAEVANANDAPTGSVTISGTATQGETLTAVTSTIADPDGPATLTFSFQWKRGGSDISGATGSTYVLTQADVGAEITVTVSWTDGGNTAESLTSAPTAAVTNTNDAPTGSVTISGTATQGETLTAVTSTIADPDGPDALTFSFQWKRDGTAITGATGATYVLAQDDVGAAITVTVSWTDGGNTAESLTSAPTAEVTGANDPPTGAVTISGAPTQGETLTAVTTTIADPDGPATLTFSFQWKRDGTAISGATDATYTLTQADVGAAITVTVSWTDDGGTAESLTSDATATVTGANDAPTADAGDAQTVAEGKTATLDGSGSSDPENETLSYAWTQSSGTTVTLNGATTAAPTFTAPTQLADDETLVFSLIVTDARGAASAPDTVTVTVTAADLTPSFSPASVDYAWTTGRDIGSVQLPAASGGNGELNYALADQADIPAGVSYADATRTFSGAPTAAGTATLTLTATDSDASDPDSAELTVNITVSEPPPPDERTIDTVAGDGTPGFSGDGRTATEAQFNTPSGVALDAQGNLYIADTYNHRVRKVDAATGAIDTVAGDELNSPADVAIDGADNLYIADTGNNRILIVDTAGAVVDTVTGTEASGPLSMPSGVAPAADGNLYIADTGNNRILIVDTAGAIVDTVTGTEASGPLSMPSGVAPAADGNLYIADTGNHRILIVDAAGAIDTVAGTGTQGFDGDGGPAVEAQLNAPSGVAVDAEGAYLYIADTGNQRIRKVDAEGAIDTVAGTGTPGYDEDGGPAVAAQLNAPVGVAVDAEGNVYIADAGNHRIRKVGQAPDETVPPVGPRPEPELPAVRARTFELSFTLAQDAEPAAQQVVLYAENGAANFRAQPGPQWIGAEPASGRLEEDEETTITVTVDPAGLRVGAYRGRLYIRSEGRLTGRVWIALEVLPPVGPAVAERGVFNAAVQSALGARTNPFSAVRLLPVAPGSMVAVSGENFTGGESFEAGGFPLPVSLGGVKVKFDGLEARLFAVSPQRIEAQLPSLLNLEALAGGGTALATVVVETAEGGSYARRFVTAAQAPGIFTASGEGRGQGAVLLAGAGALAAPRGYAAESRPARAGEVLEIYATGLGPMYPPVADGENSCGPEGVCLADGANLVLRRTVERPRVSIGGVEVAEEAVLFAGLAPALAAVNLVVVEVPEGIEPSAAAEALISIGGRTSQPGVTIAVE